MRTYDEHLADSYTEVRQRITKRLYILDEIEINKRYSILAHIGLTSVKFDANRPATGQPPALTPRTLPLTWRSMTGNRWSMSTSPPMCQLHRD